MFENKNALINKKEWLIEYKRICNAFKTEEKQLISSYLSSDFHLQKIYSSNKDEVEAEIKNLSNSRKGLKSAIDDIYSYYSGHGQLKSSDIKHKFYKIEDNINKYRLDYKSRFESLLLAEDQLEKELTEFSENFGKVDQAELEDSQSESLVSHNNYLDKNKDKIDAYIEYIINAVNSAFNEYPIEDVAKAVEKMDNIETIKNKTLIVDYVIDKKLGGAYLTWQPREHGDFLKVCASHNGKISTYEFISDLEGVLPFLPRSELRSHIKLYNQYLQLVELKRLLINKYKSVKAEKESRVKQALLENIEKQKVENDHKKSSTDQQYQKAQKQKVGEWKVKKSNEKQEKQEEELKLQQEIREKERIKNLERNRIVQPLIDDYKRRKSLVRQSFDKGPSCEKVEISEIDLERIKDKNSRLLERKKSMITCKSLSKIKTAESYTKYKLKKMEEHDRIEPKIFEKTENAQNKQRKKHDYKSNRTAESMANNVLGHVGRAVPQWRKSLY